MSIPYNILYNIDNTIYIVFTALHVIQKRHMYGIRKTARRNAKYGAAGSVFDVIGT